MSAIPGGIKRRLKPLFYRGKRRVVSALLAYDASALAGALRELGVEPGCCLFVHAGFDAFNGFRGTASDCVDALAESVSPDGHLLMVSMAYRGASEAYARSGTVFDAARTPSVMGMVSEVFRRRPGTVRSLSPLHPVLASGPRAKWLVADHELLARSCGPGSPFERFLVERGKVLFLDAPFSSLTFMHYVEDRHRDRFPFPLYGAEELPIRVRDPGGGEIEVAQRLFSPEIRQRRTFDNVEQALRRDGLLRSRRLGNSRLMLTDAEDVVRVAQRLVESGGGGLHV